MKFKNLFLIFVVISFIFISGCSSDPDCSSKDSTYVKYSYDEVTDSCVAKTISKNICGNGVAEEGENSCNCPKDVSSSDPDFGCSGTVGEYIEKTCNDKNECVLMQNDKVVQETKSLEFKNSDLIFNSEIKTPKPYILNTADKNKITVDITLFKFVSSYKDIKNVVVKELKLENSNSVLLASITYNQKLSSIGSSVSTQKVALANTTAYETSQTIRAKLIVSYIVDTLDSKGVVTKSEEKIETLTESLGKITIINPNFEEED